MIEISEKVIQGVIKEGLSLVKNNEELFDRIFRKLNVTEAERLKTYITGNKVTVTQGYPVNRSKLPCYAIMLGGENENEEHIGDFATELTLDEANEAGLETSEVVIEEVVKVERYGDYFKFNTSKRNVQAVTYAVTMDDETVDLSGLEILDEVKGEVMVMDEDLEHGKSIRVSYVYTDQGYSSYGSMFNKSYRIEVWATNGDLTIHLYHLLKWILLASKTVFYNHGWHEIKLGGADFEPVPEDTNEITYRRALSLTFSVEETFELEDEYIQDIIVKYNKQGG